MTYWAPVFSIRVSDMLLGLFRHRFTSNYLTLSIFQYPFSYAVRLAMDRETGRQRGFGHIDFKGKYLLYSR